MTDQAKRMSAQAVPFVRDAASGEGTAVKVLHARAWKRFREIARRGTPE